MLASDLRPAAASTSGRAFLGVERSLSGRRWVERLDERGTAAALAIAQRLEVPDIVARVLAGRGVPADQAADFLAPKLRALLPDPSSLSGMDAAAARIADAIVSGERVAIFGDYDVDGATSAALLARFLRHQGLQPAIYIPDRLFEGYGPNVAAVRKLGGDGARLIVTVDCGSTSPEALGVARDLGIDVVVIDHHALGEHLPPAVAVVNPNRQDDLSGLGYLAAVGVTFLTIIAINRLLRSRGWYANGRVEPDLMQWLDLVALGTVADVVPLAGLNRALVVAGLAAIARRSNPGLAALSVAARVNGPVSPYHLGFLLGPRINAGGRIGDAALGSRLLATENAGEAAVIAAELDRLNGERQAIEAAMLAEAIAEAEAEIGSGPGPAVLVTSNARWHPGVVGLIAARLRERFQRPAIAIAFNPNGEGQGSGRSVPGVDLGRAIRAAQTAGILLKGGGHAMAAGLTVSAQRLGELRAFLSEALAAAIAEAGDDGGLLIDAAVSGAGVSVELIDLVERAGPFGAGHAEPVFALRAQRIAYADAVGNGHLRVSFASEDGATVRGLLFRGAESPLGKAIAGRRGALVHVAGTLSVDHWQGVRRPSLKIIDAAAPD
jgi:single-stranded-DNA-specific exonuclease